MKDCIANLYVSAYTRVDKVQLFNTSVNSYYDTKKCFQ